MAEVDAKARYPRDLKHSHFLRCGVASSVANVGELSLCPT